jgi:hypothetical protein
MLVGKLYTEEFLSTVEQAVEEFRKNPKAVQ